MKNIDLRTYIVEKQQGDCSDKLWKKGEGFVLYDKNDNVVAIEGYGSYANFHHNFGENSVSGVYSDYDTNFDEYGSRTKLFFRVQ